jgi:2,3-dihydroxybenzoate-AMP ligase
MVREPIEGVVYPPAELVARYRASGALTDDTLGAALHDAFVRHASRTALVTPDVRLTYRALDELTDKAAAALLRLGLRPLDRVLLQIGNVAEFFTVMYGCFKAGLVPVCTLAAHRDAEIGFLGPFTQARAHIVQGDDARLDLVSFALGMRAKSGVEHVIVVRGQGRPGAVSLAALMERENPAAARRTIEALAIDPWNVGIFQLSGGTTGLPKVIPRFQNDYLANIRAMRDWARIDHDTVAYWPLPAVHNAAMIVFNTPTHLAGGTVCVQQAVDPVSFLSMIQRERVTYAGGVLPVVVRAVECERLSEFDLSSVRQFISTNETPLVESKLKVPGYHIFGMAEGLCMLTRPEDPEPVRMTMIGCPISPWDEVRLVRPESEELVAEGEDGEFCCRGPYTLHGYYRAEEHNRRAFTSDGLYRSGDLMRATRIGGTVYYAFLGRLKDNVDRGAEKISAEEVERFVGEHAAVQNVAVIGMPDPVFGERVCAYLILKPGTAAPSIEELGAFLEQKGLAKFKWPERIEVVDNFPVTKVGKVSKGLLRDDIKAKLKREQLLKTA